MNITQDFNARRRHAYFGLEPEIHDLRHMASIAQTLISDIGVSEIAGGSGIELEISLEEFERIQFAIGQTKDIANNLVKAFEKELEEARTLTPSPTGAQCCAGLASLARALQPPWRPYR
jgi:hypothetical protein